MYSVKGGKESPRLLLEISFFENKLSESLLQGFPLDFEREFRGSEMEGHEMGEVGYVIRKKQLDCWMSEFMRWSWRKEGTKRKLISALRQRRPWVEGFCAMGASATEVVRHTSTGGSAT